MSSYGQVAAKIRAEKEAHPERFCPNRKCLWRIVTAQGPNPCRNHQEQQRRDEPRIAAFERIQAAADSE
jgi:hypothetical protein